MLFLVGKEETTVVTPKGMADIVAFCPQVKSAPELKKRLEESGVSVNTMSVTYGVAVPNGYRLIVRGDKGMIEAFHAALKVRKLESQFLEDKTALQYGGVYKSEKEAKAKAASVSQRAGVAFQVEPSTKQVKKPCVKFIVPNVSKALADGIVDVLESSGCVDINVKDVEPASEGSKAEEG
ncbi:hypothetical protein IJT17_10355 [bacterium]|nr:hypothetical protein [bacterium]